MNNTLLTIDLILNAIIIIWLFRVSIRMKNISNKISNQEWYSHTDYDDEELYNLYT